MHCQKRSLAFAPRVLPAIRSTTTTFGKFGTEDTQIADIHDQVFESFEDRELGYFLKRYTTTRTDLVSLALSHQNRRNATTVKIGGQYVFRF